MGVTPQSTPWGVYGRIAKTLRDRVAVLAPGTPVESEAALAAEFQVVRNTVRRALAELEAEGLIETVPGRGRVVRKGDAGNGEDGPLPAYRRIALGLKAAIDSGQLAAGDRLPSEAELMREHGVSRGTARQALAVLEAAGLVDVVHGKGRFVHGA